MKHEVENSTFEPDRVAKRGAVPVRSPAWQAWLGSGRLAAALSQPRNRSAAASRLGDAAKLGEAAPLKKRLFPSSPLQLLASPT